MPLIVVYISVFVSSVAVSSHAQGLIDIALQCGPDHLQFAENQAVQCTPGDDSVYCFGAFSGLNITQARACSSLTDSSSCMSSCREFLHDTVDDGGCHVDTVFNPRFSLGTQILQVAFDACNVELSPACESPVNLTIPNSVGQCTFEEFWGRVMDYLCTTSVGQPYVDTLLMKFITCVLINNIARHSSSYCGRANGRYCLDILQGSFPLVNPTQTAFVNSYLKNVTFECANCSSFASDVPCTL